MAAGRNALHDELPLHRQYPWKLFSRSRRQILEIGAERLGVASNVIPVHEKQAEGAAPAPVVHRWNATPGASSSFPDGSFDCIILSDTLDTLAERAEQQHERFDPVTFLRGITRCLAPGGTIAGSVRNRLAGLLPGARGGARAVFSAHACRRLLRRAGCEEVAVFGLHRRESTAMLLISTRHEAFRSFAMRDLMARRHTLSGTGYLARWLLARSGVGRFFQPELLFAARRS